ncbi:MAG: glycosyltransferase family 4 protein [Bacteroidales bacterium]|nr:glycosyltransferase family 4 protein [Bacteroidales bacterium]
MNKRIAIIVDDFPSPGRPVFVFVQQLVITLADQGVEIDVVAPQSLTHALFRGEALRPRDSIEETQGGHQFRVHRPFCVSFGIGHKFLYRLSSKFNQHGLTKTLKKVRPDVIYGHFWHSANKALDYAVKNRLPVFVACGEGDDALELLVDRMPPERKRLLAEMVKGVVCVSSENKRKCLEYGLARDSNTIVLPNCVDDHLFKPMDGKAERASLGIKDDDFVISFTGAFIKRKGSLVLSDAVKKLADPQIKLIFMGKPLKGDDCTPDCPGIAYMASTEHNIMPKYLNASDVFVLPTLKEGCCNAIVEALACGIPVISSNRPFNDDILNEDNSIVVNPEDADAVAKAISLMKSDKTFYAKKKDYALIHSGNYSITDRAHKIINFINEKIS